MMVQKFIKQSQGLSTLYKSTEMVSIRLKAVNSYPQRVRECLPDGWHDGWEYAILWAALSDMWK